MNLRSWSNDYRYFLRHHWLWVLVPTLLSLLAIYLWMRSTVTGTVQFSYQI